MQPLTVLNYFATTRKFLSRNKVRLDDEFWEDLLGSGSPEATTLDAPPSREELKRIEDRYTRKYLRPAKT